MLLASEDIKQKQNERTNQRQQQLKQQLRSAQVAHSSGAVWESRWTSWAVRPNGPRSLRSFSGGFRGRAFHSLAPFPLCPRP